MFAIAIELSSFFLVHVYEHIIFLHECSLFTVIIYGLAIWRGFQFIARNVKECQSIITVYIFFKYFREAYSYLTHITRI